MLTLQSKCVSFNSMFGSSMAEGSIITEIEIPLIQRDYAQGRTSASVSKIRELFLGAIHDAVTGGSPLTLDFVYGEIRDKRFYPLDGQQRLTTLFLLHWYLAVRVNALGEDRPWKNFSYATRSSARMFCKTLVGYQATGFDSSIAADIKDQPWFLHTWRNDPTIESMLVMLDAMHGLFRGSDCLAAWKRLIDEDEPAISFYLLPIDEMGGGDDLYIKMNSRGKALTPFENFKARFGQLIERTNPEASHTFAHKIDGVWLDAFWKYRGDTSGVDDKILRYFHFVAELCAWSQELRPADDIYELTNAVFGARNPEAGNHLAFLFDAFEAWVNVDAAGHFDSLFRLDSGQPAEDKVTLFAPFIGVDLLSACLDNYGEMKGSARKFSWPSTLLLYAVLLDQIMKNRSFPRQLRVVRNLVEASGNELRLEKMPALLADVRRIIVDGTIEGCSAFNQAQLDDEAAKASFLAANESLTGALLRLEDHNLLRGNLAVFDLDSDMFEPRANAFHRSFCDRLFGQLTGALLTVGDYSRRLANGRIHLFGAKFGAWSELFAAGGRGKAAKTRHVLADFLDRISASGGDVSSVLATMQAEWLAAKADSSGFDWRWYFVKYPIMRGGTSGKYVGEDGSLGYCVCMLDKHQMNSNYRDAYLSAAHAESNVDTAVGNLQFSGHETLLRQMIMMKSGLKISNTREGFQFEGEVSERYERIMAELGVDAGDILRISKVEINGAELDAVDRVQVGADMLRKLVAAGF